jgi:hypothetical protein
MNSNLFEHLAKCAEGVLKQAGPIVFWMWAGSFVGLVITGGLIFDGIVRVSGFLESITPKMLGIPLPVFFSTGEPVTWAFLVCAGIAFGLPIISVQER